MPPPPPLLCYHITRSRPLIFAEIKYIERIPRYNMLLRDLLRKTSPGTAAYANLERALEKMKKTADDLNEKKRIAENKSHVADLLDNKFTWPSKKEVNMLVSSSTNYGE